MSDDPRRPCWKRKRWAAVLALLVVAAPPLGLGPVMYCLGRAWVPPGGVRVLDTSLNTVFTWLNAALGFNVQRDTGYGHYLKGWYSLGERHRHAASD